MDEGTTLEPVGVGVSRLALRTPTHPPATHTNCYFLGFERFYVVEPASPWPEEQARLAAATRVRIELGDVLVGAIVTHHHLDHTGGARAFCDEFEVPLLGHPITRDKLMGRVQVDETLEEGGALDPSLARLDMEVLVTPGHAPGHLCLFSHAHGWMIVGDMVASVGTILVDPDDDGDMDAYLTQLGRLARLGPKRLLPAHGAPIDEAVELLSYYVKYRLAREARVLAAVDEVARTATEVAALAYADSPTAPKNLAERSTRAHLERLAKLGDVRREGERWRRRAVYT